MPPKWMWHLEHELEDWFEMVTQRRNNPTKTDDIDDGAMMKNELSRR